MRVIIDVVNIKEKVAEMLVNSYGFNEGTAEFISQDVRDLIAKNEDD